MPLPALFAGGVAGVAGGFLLGEKLRELGFFFGGQLAARTGNFILATLSAAGTLVLATALTGLAPD